MGSVCRENDLADTLPPRLYKAGWANEFLSVHHWNTWHRAFHQDLAGLCNYILSSQIRHDTVSMLTVGRWMMPDPAQNLPGYKILKPNLNQQGVGMHWFSISHHVATLVVGLGLFCSCYFFYW